MGVEWAEAEDAFLRFLCVFEELGPVVRYSNPGQRNRRFNAVRILSREVLEAPELRERLDELSAFFHERQLPLSLQMPEPLTPVGLSGDWVAEGPTFHHVATDLKDFASASGREVQLRPVDSEDTLEIFADMVADTRIPESHREQARPGVLASMRASNASPDVSMSLVHDGDQLVGQVASARCARGWCVSTLTVVPEARGQGYMKAIYAALAATLDGVLYGQIAEGTKTLPYRQRFPSTEVLARTRTFQRTSDPYRGL